MPRSPREDFPGAIHHVMNRSARHRPVFKTDEHCLLFLEALGDTVERYGLGVLAYGLMPNHFHLLVRSPDERPVLSRAMRFLLSTYSQRVNRLRRWDGPIFRGRFKSQLVRNDVYLAYVIAYIHLNPLRARLVRRLDDEAWTSMRAYLSLDTPPPWLWCDWVERAVGDGQYLCDLAEALHLKEEPWPAGMSLDAGWVDWGAAPVPPASKRRARKVATPGRPTMKLSKALRIAAQIAGVRPAELKVAQRGRGANAARRFAVWAVARSTGATAREIGAALGMTGVHVSVILHRLRGSKPEPLRSWCADWTQREQNM